MTALEDTPVFVRITLILVGIIAACFIIYIGQSVILPLIFALFTAILINPFTNFLIRIGVNRVVAIFLSILLVILVIGLLVFFVSMQVSMFSSTYPQLKEKFNSTGADLVNWCSGKFNVEAAVIEKWVKETGKDMVKNSITGVGNTLLSVGSALVVMVLIPVYVFLILYYKHLLLEFIRKLFRAEHHANVAEVLIRINTLIRSYLGGLLIEGAIVATLNSIGLLALGVKYAILLGITGAILNVIPYIGGVVAFALPMIIAFVTKSPLSALLVFVVYTVIQFIDNHYLIPYIVASKVKINALMAIVVVLIGNVLCGIPGMFLAIPLVALVKVIFDHIEPMKPWGFLLGDTVPSTIKLPFSRVKKE